MAATFFSGSYLYAQNSTPALSATALDGRSVVLPRDLTQATVFIVGFTRASADATTAWEIPVRTQLAHNATGFYDVAVLASVPGVLHGWVTHTLRGKVPAVLQGRFLPVFGYEAAWKQVCGYDPNAPDSAYVLLVDSSGKVLWRTHEAYSAKAFNELNAQDRELIERPNR